MSNNLNDVWRDVSSRIGFFTYATHEHIPAKTGIYAWFYPLRIYSKEPYEFLKEINQVFYYDASVENDPQKEVPVDFNWDRILLNVTKSCSDKGDSESVVDKWKNIVEDPTAKYMLQTAVMESSILMPPLYVGRTDNLRQRYLQHVKGGSSNDFNRRFSRFAEKKHIHCEVRDLLFVCITTHDAKLKASFSKELSEVIEEILKVLCQPVYGKK